MPLDFVSAKNKGESVFVEPEFTICEKEHEEFFFGMEYENIPMLLRLSSYYSDAIFQSGDVDALLRELELVQSNSIFANKLKKLCEKSIECSNNIYVFCD